MLNIIELNDMMLQKSLTSVKSMNFMLFHETKTMMSWVIMFRCLFCNFNFYITSGCDVPNIFGLMDVMLLKPRLFSLWFLNWSFYIICIQVNSTSYWCQLGEDAFQLPLENNNCEKKFLVFLLNKWKSLTKHEDVTIKISLNWMIVHKFLNAVTLFIIEK